MTIYTIGFTKKPARTFFSELSRVGARKLVDVRLNNVSQLSGFAKCADLEYFLREICDMDYAHDRRLAPTQLMLDSYKKYKGAWQSYEEAFLGLMQDRKIEETIPRESLQDACLLCSEDKPHFCHRRLVAEYLQQQWEDVEVVHLLS